jgi:hypothetical protein
MTSLFDIHLVLFLTNAWYSYAGRKFKHIALMVDATRKTILKCSSKLKYGHESQLGARGQAGQTDWLSVIKWPDLTRLRSTHTQTTNPRSSSPFTNGRSYALSMEGHTENMLINYYCHVIFVQKYFLICCKAIRSTNTTMTIPKSTLLG